MIHRYAAKQRIPAQYGSTIDPDVPMRQIWSLVITRAGACWYTVRVTSCCNSTADRTREVSDVRTPPGLLRLGANESRSPLDPCLSSRKYFVRLPVFLVVYLPLVLVLLGRALQPGPNRTHQQYPTRRTLSNLALAHCFFVF